MKRTSPAALLICLLTVVFTAQAQEQPATQECVEKNYLLAAGAEVVTRICGEHQTVTAYIPANVSALSVQDIRKKGTAKEAYSAIANKNTILIASGGFFGFRSDGAEKPIGLIRSNGKRLVKLMEWDHGGILVSDRKGNVKIIPAQNRNQAGAWSEAVQSKPIIVYKGAVDIRKNPRDAEFNRVAVGYTLEGEMLVVGVFHSFSQASTLYDFAQTFKEIADSRRLKIHRAIALDGGAGAQIHIPSKGLLFGDSGRSYFPNAIRIDRLAEK
ncbi:MULTISPECIES: phosphodiester glycosidase family protein [unclassified Pseudomonas]|jgi:hypothetical protein|uniref:phosphodiester glycosidase family protein n=1 Tax=unclassified Pseudomonas TaxID=196821 RepID=UPI001C439EDE|nr:MULTISPECIES: phosphodiester glycosidase family protein [unclassified Pseudomonas]MBV7510024.1 phosphodiester glycosidase family protein [Pseudomonas sp. PDM25]